MLLRCSSLFTTAVRRDRQAIYEFAEPLMLDNDSVQLVNIAAALSNAFMLRTCQDVQAVEHGTQRP
jgi:hypothetical protein